MDNHAFLHNLVAFLSAAVLAVPLFQRLGLGSVLGYLAAGSLLGPYGLGLVRDVKSVMSFAELGVVMLLFVIGLELKPSRLWVMRRAVFGMGGAQVTLTTAVLALLGYATGQGWPTAMVAGLGLSLSSTAFALQILSDRNQINTAHGRSSFSILLFQDLTVIPLMALLPLLDRNAEVSSSTGWVGATKALLVMAVVVVGGRYLLRPVFRLIASARTKEVFTGAALLLVVGIALLMESVGLSMALGSFLAGVLLADSEYRHELETDIDPFKGLLLGLFFMGVGMSVDYGLLLRQPLTITALVVGFMAVKYAVVFGIGRAAGFSAEASTSMATVLPQGGEFAFVLFGVATQAGIMATELADLLVVAVALSMALTPVLVIVNERFFCRRLNTTQARYDELPAETNPVIIAGFGRVGQMVGRILRVQGIGFTALEHDSEQVQLVRRFGNEIYYGDASRLDLLETAGAKKARAFVLAIDDVEASLRTAKVVREHFPQLRIFARARNRPHVFELLAIGVTVVNRETFASSLELARDILVELGTPGEKAGEVVRKFREHDERVLAEQQQFYGDEKKMINASRQAALQLAELFRADSPKS